MVQAWIWAAFFLVFAVFCVFSMYRQHMLFSDQLDKLQKVAEDGIDALGDSLKKARERISQLEEDYRYEKELAKKLDCDLQEKCKEVEEMAEQKLALEKALNVHAESLLQNCIDAFAEAAAMWSVDLDREVECDCES